MADWAPLHDYSRSRAVLIGTWDYVNLPSIPAVENSLKRMVSLLVGPLCGWPEDRISVFANERSPGDVPDRLITAFEDVTDVALFYYAGHGQIDVDDQLCLGLVASRTEANRRAATSLPFQAVRRALLDSHATTRIVILDCCFAGLANRPVNTLTGLADDVLDKTAGAGAYTMAASGAYTTAWFETGTDIAQPQTFFTRYLADVVESGIPGEAPGLRLHPLFARVRDNLARDQLPVPCERSIDAARNFVFAHNAAPPETHRDPDAELRSLAQRLAEAEASRAQDRADAEAQEQDLRAKAAELTQELERLKEQARHRRPMATTQRQALQDAIEQTGRSLDETAAAQAAAAERAHGVLVTASTWRDASAPAGNTADTTHHPSDDANAALTVVPAPRKRRRALLTTLIAALSILAVAGVTGVVLWALPHQARPSARLVRTLADPFSEGVTAVAFSPHGTTLATSDENGNTYLWDTATGQVIATLTDPSSQGVATVAFSPAPLSGSDGRILATGDWNGHTYLWDATTGRIVATLTDPRSKGVTTVAFSPATFNGSGGKTLATGDRNGHTYLWDTATGRIIATLTDPSSMGVYAVAFRPASPSSPDGTTLATSDWNGNVYLWDTATGHRTATLAGRAASANPAVAFSPDATTLAGSDYYGHTYLWDTATGHRTATLTDPPAQVSVFGLAFSPSGRTLAVGECTGDVYLWDTATRHRTATLTDPPARLVAGSDASAVAFSPNGKTLAATDCNGSTYLWRVGG